MGRLTTLAASCIPGAPDCVDTVREHQWVGEALVALAIVILLVVVAGLFFWRARSGRPRDATVD